IESRAHAALAALGLAAVSLQRAQGCDLRSRCAFVPEGPLSFELLDRNGAVQGNYTLEAEDAIALVQTATEAAREVGMAWPPRRMELKPAPRLVALRRMIREVTAQGEAEAGEA